MHREIQIKQFPIVTTHWWPKTRNERFVWENVQYLYRFLPLVHNHVQVIWVRTHIWCVTCVCVCSGSPCIHMGHQRQGGRVWSVVLTQLVVFSCWKTQCCQIGRFPAQLGGFEFDCAGKYWFGRVDTIWAGFWSVWRFSKHINCIG